MSCRARIMTICTITVIVWKSSSVWKQTCNEWSVRTSCPCSHDVSIILVLHGYDNYVVEVGSSGCVSARQDRNCDYPNDQYDSQQVSSQSEAPPTSLDPAASSFWCGSNDVILVFILNFPSRPRARTWWPEPNGLLALPTENQTLCCERVLRQETSIAYIFGKVATELPVLYSGSSAQLPLQSRVDSKLS